MKLGASHTTPALVRMAPQRADPALWATSMPLDCWAASLRTLVTYAPRVSRFGEEHNAVRGGEGRPDPPLQIQNGV